jgi:hypothetical protein
MDNVKQRANEARDLMGNHAFQSVIAEIRAEAAELFLNASSDMVSISGAHERVRATQTILDALQVRLNAEMAEDKQKAKHRG